MCIRVTRTMVDTTAKQEKKKPTNETNTIDNQINSTIHDIYNNNHKNLSGHSCRKMTNKGMVLKHNLHFKILPIYSSAILFLHSMCVTFDIFFNSLSQKKKTIHNWILCHFVSHRSHVKKKTNAIKAFLVCYNSELYYCILFGNFL